MKKLYPLLLLLLLSVYFLPQVLAADPTAGESNPGSPDTTVKLPNPLTGSQSSKPIPDFLGQIINYAMGIMGSLALVMFIYGGALWMLSAGNTEQVSKGKQVIIWAALGIAIVFTAYALVRFVIIAVTNYSAP